MQDRLIVSVMLQGWGHHMWINGDYGALGLGFLTDTSQSRFKACSHSSWVSVSYFSQG